MDGNFCEGDSVDVANIRITARSIGDGVDYVRVNRTNKYVDPNPPEAGSTRGKPNTINDGCVYGQGADRDYFFSMNSSIDQGDEQWVRLTERDALVRNFRSQGCGCCGCAPLETVDGLFS